MSALRVPHRPPPKPPRVNPSTLTAPQYGVLCPLAPRTDNPACPDRPRAPTAAERARLRALRESVAVDCRRLYANPRAAYGGVSRADRWRARSCTSCPFRRKGQPCYRADRA